MALNLGVNVVEVDGSASPSISGAATSTPGFLLRSPRGVPNNPVALTGFADFQTNFGSYIEAAYGAHAVRGFFDNGGDRAFAARIVGAGAAAAEQTLDDRGGAPTLRVLAGMKGQQDPGGWGDNLQVTITDNARGTANTPAQVRGTNTEPFALADGDALDLTVNGASVPVTVTFAAADFNNIGAASASEVASSIRRQTTAVRVAATDAQDLMMASATSGANSRVDIAGTAATALGFIGAAANTDGGILNNETAAKINNTDGFINGSAVSVETRAHVIAPAAMAAGTTDGASILVTVDGGAAVEVTFSDSQFVGGAAAITPGEVVAAINSQAVGFVAALTDTDELVLSSGSYGTGATIAVAAGGTDATADLGLTGAVPVAGTEENRLLDRVDETQGLVSWATPLTSVVVANASRIRSAEFDLVVQRNGVEIERFSGLSMQGSLEYAATSVINDPFEGSRYVTVEDLASASGPVLDVPAETALSAMTTLGNDGATPVDLDYVGNPATRSGLYAFDSVEIQLLACPETTAVGVALAALSYCELRGDCMYVGTAPEGYDLEQIKIYAGELRGRKVFGALYSPWIQISNPLDTTGNRPRISVPPIGHVLGTFARIAEQRGIFKAPAGDGARLANALGVEFDMSDVDHTDLVRNGAVNGIRAIPGSGIVIDASRTLSSDTNSLFVGTRLLLNFIKASLRDGLRFVSQEPHTESLRRSVRLNVVTPFLLGLWRQGAFDGESADLSFQVICDESNNPPAEVALGNFRLDVLVRPTNAIETILLTVGQLPSSATVSET